MAQRSASALLTALAATGVSASQTCLLTNKQPVISQPSLVTCFSRSERVCCGSAHDFLIGEAVQSLFPPSCTAKFKEFQTLFCSVCDYSATVEEESFLRHVAATADEVEHIELDMCTDFLKTLWGSENFELPSTAFDTCGFLLDPDEVANNGGTILIPMNQSESLPGQPNLIHDVDTFLDWLSPRFPKVFGNLPVKFRQVSTGTGTGPLCGNRKGYLDSSSTAISVLVALAVSALGLLF